MMGKEEDLKELQSIAKILSDFRLEYVDRLMQDIKTERDGVIDAGFDPAIGSGRGPWWAEGA